MEGASVQRRVWGVGAGASNKKPWPLPHFAEEGERDLDRSSRYGLSNTRSSNRHLRVRCSRPPRHAVRDAGKPVGAPGHEGCGASGLHWLPKAPAPVPVRVPEAEKCVYESQLRVTRRPSPKVGSPRETNSAAGCEGPSATLSGSTDCAAWRTHSSETAQNR